MSCCSSLLPVLASFLVWFASIFCCLIYIPSLAEVLVHLLASAVLFSMMHGFLVISNLNIYLTIYLYIHVNTFFSLHAVVLPVALCYPILSLVSPAASYCQLPFDNLACTSVSLSWVFDLGSIVFHEWRGGIHVYLYMRVYAQPFGYIFLLCISYSYYSVW